MRAPPPLARQNRGMGKSGPVPGNERGPARLFARLARGLVRWARHLGRSRGDATLEAATATPARPEARSAPRPAAERPGTGGGPGGPPRLPGLVGEAVPCVVDLPWRDWLAARAESHPPSGPRLLSLRATPAPDTTLSVLRSAQAATDAVARRLPSPLWTVSVVLVASGRRDGLLAAVTSVTAQSYPSWELLVVETSDGPPPAPATVDPRVRVLHAPGAALPVARSRAIEAAAGTLVAHLDEHARMAPHWLAAVVATLAEAPSADVAVGLVLEADDHPLPDLVDAGLAGRVRLVPDRAILEPSCVAHRRGLYPGFPGSATGELSTLLDAGVSLRHVGVPAAAVPLSAAALPVADPGGVLIDLTAGTGTGDRTPLAVAGR